MLHILSKLTLGCLFKFFLYLCTLGLKPVFSSVPDFCWRSWGIETHNYFLLFGGRPGSFRFYGKFFLIISSTLLSRCASDWYRQHCLVLICLVLSLKCCLYYQSHVFVLSLIILNNLGIPCFVGIGIVTSFFKAFSLFEHLHYFTLWWFPCPKFVRRYIFEKKKKMMSSLDSCYPSPVPLAFCRITKYSLDLSNRGLVVQRESSFNLT